MTKFDPKNSIIACLTVTTQEEADNYLSEYATYIFLNNEDDVDMKKATQIARDNIGYATGYGTLVEAEKTEKLFKCTHPVLGSVEERRKLTTNQIFQMGKDYYQKIQDEKTKEGGQDPH